MFTVLIKIILFILIIPFSAAAQTSIPMEDLNINPNRVPQWYPFDETTYNAAQTSWPVYDVTCENGPCGSGKLPWSDEAAFVTASCVDVVADPFSGVSCFVGNAPDDTVLYFPADTYVIDDIGIRLNRSNLVIRGAGHTQTIFRRDTRDGFNNFGDCGPPNNSSHIAVCVSNYDSGSTVAWTAKYARNDTIVTLASVAAYDEGDWIRLDMTDTTDCVHLDNSNNKNVFSHIAKVICVDGESPCDDGDYLAANQLEIDRGLQFDYDGAGCTGFDAKPFDPIENVGIEDLRMTTWTGYPRCTDSTRVQGDCFKFRMTSWAGVANSWIVGVRMDRTFEMWIHFLDAVRNWVQGSQFDDLDLTLSFNTEGIRFTDGGNDNIIENNLCFSTRVCSKIENGAEGNIMGYNFFDQTGGGFFERSIFIHGRYVRGILYEGNHVDGLLGMSDFTWGHNGPYTTSYRNRNDNPSCDGTTDSITFDQSTSPLNAPYPLFVNIIGNAMGGFTIEPKKSSDDDLCPTTVRLGAQWADIDDNVWIEKNAYRVLDQPLGVNVGTNSSCGLTLDDVCPGTNKNVESPDSLWTTESYPTSFYHTSKPSWWCDEACAWDQSGIGAFGDTFREDDFDNNCGTPPCVQTTGQPDGLWDADAETSALDLLCKLPAQIRTDDETCTLDGASTGGTGVTGGSIGGGGSFN